MSVPQVRKHATASTRLLVTGPHLSCLVSGVGWEFDQEIGTFKENIEKFAMKVFEKLDSTRKLFSKVCSDFKNLSDNCKSQ